MSYGGGASHQFHPSILRDYDMRGVVGQTLGPDDARWVGRVFGTLVRRGGGERVVVGYDGRLSSPGLETALVAGLAETGVAVRRVGMGPTPMLYFAAASAPDVQGGIQVTGSHNPANHNGFKMVCEGRPFFGADIVRLGQMAAAGEWDRGPVPGPIETVDILDRYVSRLLRGLDGIDPQILASLKIGWDAGNGAAGPAMEELAARLPGEHHLLFANVDGHFPNHHPDPTVPANLADLQRLVSVKSLDFGLAFDGDGDRIGVVDGQGRILWGDQILLILAEDQLRRTPGVPIVADVKASAALFARIAALGGQPVMWKSGHSQINSKMNEVSAPLAGEMSGHLFFGGDYYGFDDALYAAVRLIAALARAGRTISEWRDLMPQTCATPELRFAVDASRKFAVVDEVRARLAGTDARVNTIDGVRVDSADGWWLLRASNTESALTARAESASEAGLARLLAQLDAQLGLSGVVRA